MKGNPAELALVDKFLADFTLKVATPIAWHDRKERWPRRIFGGTCFFLRFANGIIGITANHVVEALEKTIAQNSNIVCQIRTSHPIDLPSLMIDRCPEWDIATFRVSEKLAQAIDATPVDCGGDWPPPKPDLGRAVTFCGFPEAQRVTSAPGVVQSFACGSLATIEDVTERDVIVTYDPDRDCRAPWATRKQPLGYNMSGCSGGPVLSHGIRNGLQRCFPIAMIIMGPREEGAGDASGWEMIKMRRIDVVQPDGTIRRKDLGWLPR
ncbi:trypsin-like peptidase domain-containing protein [Acidibrevibacterium fodinaquatile]|uniref:trypsin-like peptidase domain-containing protein n=1 Tax=Acidibrevibacterium fodinaquatile TaxID=1969806 RepID=UPI0013B4292A|nr:trypsin-like peptidase domain-containing protein [Acidibrevibacterium fodinaquatile]